MGEADKPKPKGQKDPFLAPLDDSQLREFFRRLESLPQPEQEAFVRRVNWNLVDAATEHRLMGWLLANLRSQDPSRQGFALELLDKMPHFRRGRHAPRFQPLLEALPTETARRLAGVFGPVLGGPPKRSAKAAPAPGPAAKAPPAPDREANQDDLQKLQSFFNKFGGAR